MNRIRRMSAAFVMAAVLGIGTAGLEAAKPGGGGGQSAICEYLSAVMSHKNVSPYIYAWAAALYEHFGCGD